MPNGSAPAGSALRRAVILACGICALAAGKAREQRQKRGNNKAVA